MGVILASFCHRHFFQEVQELLNKPPPCRRSVPEMDVNSLLSIPRPLTAAEEGQLKGALTSLFPGNLFGNRRRQFRAPQINPVWRVRMELLFN